MNADARSYSPPYKNCSQQLPSNPHCYYVSLNCLLFLVLTALLVRKTCLSVLLDVLLSDKTQQFLHCLWDVNDHTSLDFTPSYQSPMLFNSSAGCHFLALAGADWNCQVQFGKIVLDCNHTLPNVDHQYLNLFSFDTLSCFSVPLVHKPSNRWSKKKFTCTVPNTFHFNITFQHLGWFLWSTFDIFHLKSWDHWFQRSLTTWHMNHYLRCGHTNSWADKKETGFGFWGVE